MSIADSIDPESLSLPATFQRTVSSSDVKAEARELLARGLEQMGHRPIGVKDAMQSFDRAIRLDPELAEAYGAIAILWANFGIFLAVAPAIALEKSNGYAHRGLALDRHERYSLATVMHNLAFYEWDVVAADAIFAQLATNHPDFTLPYQVALYTHAARGDAARVREYGEHVLALDPSSVDAVSDYAYALLLVGEARDAATLMERHLALHPTASEVHRRLGLALLQLEETPRALEHLEQSVALSRRHVWGVANLACARAKSGDEAGARALLAELEERADGELVPAIALAFVHAALGDLDAGLSALSRAVVAGDYWLLAVDVDPLLAPLRADPRFAAIVAPVRRRVYPAHA